MNHLLQQELFSQLATIDEHIIKTELNIMRQRERVGILERANFDTSFSLDLLQTFQRCLALRHQHRQRILYELEAAT
jgi:hypothetical protein